jgi:hypothetical protein
MRAENFENPVQEFDSLEKTVLAEIRIALTSVPDELCGPISRNRVYARLEALFIDLSSELSEKMHVCELLSQSVNDMHASVLRAESECYSTRMAHATRMSEMIETETDNERLDAEISKTEESVNAMNSILSGANKTRGDARTELFRLRESTLRSIADCDSRITVLSEQKSNVFLRQDELSCFDNGMNHPTSQSHNAQDIKRMYSAIDIQDRIGSLVQQCAGLEERNRDYEHKHERVSYAMKRLDEQCTKANRRKADLAIANERLTEVVNHSHLSARDFKAQNASSAARASISHKTLEMERRTYKYLNESILNLHAENEKQQNAIRRASLSLTHIHLDKVNLEKTTCQTAGLHKSISNQVSALQCLINAQEETRNNLIAASRLEEEEMNSVVSATRLLEKVNDNLLLNYRLRSKELAELIIRTKHNRTYMMSLDSSVLDLNELSRTFSSQKTELKCETQDLRSLLVDSHAAASELRALLKGAEEERMRIRELDANIECVSNVNVHPWTVKRTLSRPLREQLETLAQLQNALVKSQTQVVELSGGVYEMRKNLISKGVVRELVDISGMIQRFKGQKNQLAASEQHLVDLHANTHELERMVRTRDRVIDKR